MNRTVKEFRIAANMSLPEAMRFLDRVRAFGLRHVTAEVFESTNIGDWELPQQNETPEHWASRNFEQMRVNSNP